MLRVNNPGAQFGLSLMLDIEQSEYFGLMTLLAGLKVLIHHHQTPPLVAQLGFSVGPGTSTFAAVRKEEVCETPSAFHFQGWPIFSFYEQ